jgi:hypothetical protein
MQVVSVESRRDRAYPYAKWFTDNVAPKRAVGANSSVIASDIIIRLPDTIVALAPDLAGAISETEAG